MKFQNAFCPSLWVSLGGRVVVMVVDGRGCVVRRDGGGGRRVVGHGPAGGGRSGRGLEVLLLLLLRLLGGANYVMLILTVGGLIEIILRWARLREYTGHRKPVHST